MIKKRVCIIGGGISGVSAAWFIHQKHPDVAIHIVDPNPELGGKIHTQVKDGFVLEGGAFWLDSADMLSFSTWLRKDLGLHDQLVPLESGPRTVFEDGHLHPFPDAPPFPLPIDSELISSSELLSVEGKERAFKEESVPPREEEGDESVASFFIRRLGEEFTEAYIEPMISSMFMVSAGQLSVQATMPKLHQLETKFGSLTAAKEKFVKLSAVVPSPALAQMSAFKVLQSWMKRDPLVRLNAPRFTLRYGLGEIIDEMREQIRPKLHLEQSVESVVRTDHGYLVATNLEQLYFETVVSAVPASIACRIFQQDLPIFANLLAQVPYTSCVSAGLAVDEAALAGLPGLDILVASDSGLHTALCSRLSKRIPVFAPEGKELLRMVLRDKPERSLATLSDQEISAIALDELTTMTGLHLQPDFCRIHRLPNMLPTPKPGHLQLLEQIKEEAARFPNLALCGDAFCGGGIPGAIRYAREQVEILCGS